MADRSSRAVALSATVALALAACSGGEIVHGNPPLPPGGAGPGAQYRYDALTRATDPAVNGEELLVIVTLSGGEMRAAALGFGVLEKLHATLVRLPGAGAMRTVLQEVDMISSTSGGSFLAAYYALNREATFAADATGATAFEGAMLKRDIEGALARRAIAELPRIGTAAVNRSDVAAEYYDRILFAEKTYADLIRLGRPYIVLNAQDTTKGLLFEFTQERFDAICSDLGAFPIARAVAASSAFHGVFAPIKLRNHARERCPPEPAWVASALRGEGDPLSLTDTPRQRLMRARELRWYRDKLPGGRAPAPGAEFFVHLGDGGAADNLGLRAPVRALASRDAEEGLGAKIARGRVGAILVIAVDATTAPDALRDADPAGPTVTGMVRDAIDGLLRTANEDAMRDASVVLARLREDARRRDGRPAVYGPVAVDLHAPGSAAERECFRRIATALLLPAEEVDALRALGRRSLAEAPEFRRFLRDFRGQERALPALPLAARFCTERPGPGRGRGMTMERGTSMRGIDHLVLAVRDLEAAGRVYERFGFTLTPRALHPWGTANRLVQFAGRNFLELLAVAEPGKIAPAAAGAFSFGAYNRDFLARREGMSMLVLDSADAGADAAAFAAAGFPALAPFHFGRDAILPDGTTARVAFTLAFAADPALPEAVLFACQQHAPHLFWKPEFQRHANGAKAASEVVLRAASLDAPAAAFARLFGPAALRRGADGATVTTGRGIVSILTPDAFEARFPGMARRVWPDTPHFAAFRIAGIDPAAQIARLREHGIAFRRAADGAVQIPPSEACGVAVEFAAA